MHIEMFIAAVCTAALAMRAAAQEIGLRNFGTVPVFAGASTVGGSPIAILGTKVRTRAGRPAQALEVKGNIQVDDSLILPAGADAFYLQNTGTDGNSVQANFPFLSLVSAVSEPLEYNFGGVNFFDSGLRSYVDAGGVGSFPNYMGLCHYAVTSGLIVNGLDNVGSDTTSPGTRLDLSGNVKVTGTSGPSMTLEDGSVQTVARNGVFSGADYAESVDVIGERMQYEPGGVLVINPASRSRSMKSSEACSTAVMGIYSTRPGVVGRRQESDRLHRKAEVPMAMIGMVPTKVSAECRAIKSGDLLVTSSKPGYAMKGTDRSLLMGAIIGKVLEPLDAGTGAPKVTVSIQ